MTIHCLFYGTHTEALEYLENTIGYNDRTPNDEQWGFVYSESGKDEYFIWLKNPKEIHQMAHEVFHLVWHIASDSGIEFDSTEEKEHEDCAKACEVLTRELLELMDKIL
jgi:hypothetical protein